MRKTLPLFLILCFNFFDLHAQNSGESSEFHKKKITKATYTEETFNSTGLINGQTTEIIPRGTMDFKISHRFGLLNSGFSNFFGLDEAHARFGFDFGLTDNLMIGTGHNTHIGTYDAFVKFKFLKQSSGEKEMPITATFFAQTAVNGRKKEDLEAIMFTPGKDYLIRNFSDRVSNVFQLIVARKFSEAFSVQIMPSIVHHDNIFLNDRDEISVYNKINAFAAGIGFRQKLTKKMHLTGEYYYQLPSAKTIGTTNSLSAGIEIVTSGHVFQMHITNSRHMLEQSFITNSSGEWGKGDILFGFNLHRKFYLKRK